MSVVQADIFVIQVAIFSLRFPAVKPTLEAITFFYNSSIEVTIGFRLIRRCLKWSA